MNLEWIQYGKTGVVWHGEINGERRFQISKMSSGSYYAMINSEQGYYGILEKAKDLEEAKRFCRWVSRAMGWI